MSLTRESFARRDFDVVAELHGQREGASDVERFHGEGFEELGMRKRMSSGRRSFVMATKKIVNLPSRQWVDLGRDIRG